MGGQEGNRGYLVQAIIALLQSLEKESWESVTLEPDAGSEKIDVCWTSNGRRRVVQVKSSRNQIGKADVERWATELERACIADEYELILVGPAAQSVVEIGSVGRVVVPCPKSLDLSGLLSEAAHLLGKFLHRVSIHNQSPQTCELMVHALVTEISILSTTGTSLSRQELIDLLKRWIAPIVVAPDHPWEQVDFKHQRGIENAVAGKRLGPLDVDACPAFSICDEIAKELERGHVYELAGTSGCGKSITAWQVARKFQTAGYVVWRPRAFATGNELLSNVPGSKSMLVVDDAHKYGEPLRSRLSEISSPDRKVLLVSTVESTLLAQVICLSPERCVHELVSGLTRLGYSLLPVVQQYDEHVGHRSGDIPLERRIEQARKQKKPWEVFWIIRGGWRTAKREIESVRQFRFALETLIWIATAQVLSCDAGVAWETLFAGLREIGIAEADGRSALTQLEQIGLVLVEDSIRTKHLAYAYQVLEHCFHSSNSADWPRLAGVVTGCALGTRWPLKGLGWLLGEGLGSSEALRFSSRQFRILLRPITDRCLTERDDIGWAAGCLSRLINVFDLAVPEILGHADEWLSWAVSGNALAAYFCGEIVNTLINQSPRDGIKYSELLSRPLVERIDINRLAGVVNRAQLEDFSSIAYLLDRICFSQPRWAQDFINLVKWDRIQTLIIGAPSDYAYAIDKLVYSLIKLASSERLLALDFVRAIVPYISRAINDSPADTVRQMDYIFWFCLGYGPKFLIGNRPPDARQRAIARRIATVVNPSAISTAMENAVSRDLEGIAWTLSFMREVDKGFLSHVLLSLNEKTFFAATLPDWKEQTGELHHLLRSFAVGKQYEPASDWIRANSDLIRGPLETLLVTLAPDVAIKFHLEGKGVCLAGRYHVRWQETAWAILSLARTNRSHCEDIVSKNRQQLWRALFASTSDSVHRIIKVFKMLFALSPDLHASFVEGISLDSDEYTTFINGLRSLQPSQKRMYRKLAKCGIKVGGRLRSLSELFLTQLDET